MHGVQCCMEKLKAQGQNRQQTRFIPSMRRHLNALNTDLFNTTRKWCNWLNWPSTDWIDSTVLNDSNDSRGAQSGIVKSSCLATDNVYSRANVNIFTLTIAQSEPEVQGLRSTKITQAIVKTSDELVGVLQSCSHLQLPAASFSQFQSVLITCSHLPTLLAHSYFESRHFGQMAFLIKKLFDELRRMMKCFLHVSSWLIHAN